MIRSEDEKKLSNNTYMFDVDKIAIKEVIFGIRTSKATIDETLSALRDAQVEHVKLFRCEKSDRMYALEVVEFEK